MNTALERTNASEELKEMLKVPMFRIAEAIRNHDGSPSAADTDPNIIASN
jgi:hemoglobin